MDHSKAISGCIEQAGSLANLSRYMVLLAKPVTHGTDDSERTEGLESNASLGLEPLYRSHKAQIPLLDEIIDIHRWRQRGSKSLRKQLNVAFHVVGNQYVSEVDGGLSLVSGPGIEDVLRFWRST